MAEYCFDCYKKYLDKNAERENLIISKNDDLDLCECCGRMKPVVVRYREQQPRRPFFLFRGKRK